MFVAKLFLESIYDGDPASLAILTNEQRQNILRHNTIARKICEVLELPRTKFDELRTKELRQFYTDLNEMLLDYPRLALYLPLYILEKATHQFKTSYLTIWRICCSMSDTREEYHIGDYLGPEESIGEPEHVIKAMHLLPWLLEYGFVSAEELLKIAKYFQKKNSIAIWGLLDGAIAANQIGAIKDEIINEIKIITKTAQTPQPKGPCIIKITEKRKKWLKNVADHYGVSPNTFRLRNPAGPFSRNIDEKDIDAILPTSKHEHLILQGSRLKGYSRPDSDYDYFIYDDRDHKMYSYDKEKGKRELDYLTKKLESMSHILLLGAWLGDNKELTQNAQLRAARHYYNMSKARQAESLFATERTTILCRLMQKGFPCAYSDISQKTNSLNSIDGDSAFYDDRFRTVATKICVKYLYLGRRLDFATWRKTLAYTIPPMIG